ncbi:MULTISPECIES: SIS domain-containing protein [Sediminibacillus]|uniref:SIS domain-containing protein n=1 Tax=Sediminibacillus TaxID=482460 RepID=UPI00047DE473|nr:SIS domain-containing protein [Sediminibacillus terrae]
MFNLSIEEIKERGAFHTATEIHHQPEVWQELLSTMEKSKSGFKEFLEGISEKHEQVHVILTGAGTSAFVGDTLAPELNKWCKQNVFFDAIPTTDIVSNPREYLKADRPTVMVSFARSGNSPESVAAVALGEKCIKDFYQVVITCNKDGQLAANTKGDDKSITVLMPEKSNDKSLAMTSSFTSMLLAGYELFLPEEAKGTIADQVIANGDRLIKRVGDHIDTVLGIDFNRIVYLGSGLLGMLAEEASLKMLELTGGQVIAFHDSSLGFRHGPKSVLNEQTVVVVFLSENEYTRKYDLDMLRQLHEEGTAAMVVAMTQNADKDVEELAHFTVSISEGGKSPQNDLQAALSYIIFAQALAMKKSMQLGITPDNPSPNGEISRVVQGVTIHHYNVEA